MSNRCDTCIARYTLFSMIKFGKMFVDIQAMAEEPPIPIPPEEKSRDHHDSDLLAPSKEEKQQKEEEAAGHDEDTFSPSAAFLQPPKTSPEYVRLRHHHMIS